MHFAYRQGILLTVGAAALLPFCCHAIEAAEDLKLRQGISFSQDIDSGFPIVAEKMDDVSVDQNRPTFIFFGASGDLNTNRQARRVVDLYRKNRSSQIKFVVVDVDHATTPECKQLLKDWYKGYIPAQTLLDRNGNKVWNQIGETDSKVMQAQVDKVLE